MKEYIRVCRGTYNPNDCHIHVELPGGGFFFRWSGRQGEGVGSYWILCDGGYYDHVRTTLESGHDIPYTKENWKELEALAGRMRAFAMSEFYRVTAKLFR